MFFLFVRKKILTLGQRGINQHQVDETRRQQRLSGHGTWSLQSKNSNSRIEKPAFQIHVRYAHGAKKVHTRIWWSLLKRMDALFENPGLN